MTHSDRGNEDPTGGRNDIGGTLANDADCGCAVTASCCGPADTGGPGRTIRKVIFIIVILAAVAMAGVAITNRPDGQVESPVVEGEAETGGDPTPAPAPPAPVDDEKEGCGCECECGGGGDGSVD